MTNGLLQLTVEWYSLSNLTKDDTYRQLTEGAATHCTAFSAQDIDPFSGDFVGAYIT